MKRTINKSPALTVSGIETSWAVVFVPNSVSVTEATTGAASTGAAGARLKANTSSTATMKVYILFTFSLLPSPLSLNPGKDRSQSSEGISRGPLHSVFSILTERAFVQDMPWPTRQVMLSNIFQ
jgi:hypothetical protein